ncbi:endonuclease VII domain-containing protein [Streptomyces sp. IMTB 2501]|uniref:endonuclease VII domain-containing protein n=1 Tax=Streptomyces sp. IMTB 2501 TaxID=1776340 RepID=UPI001C4BFA7A|nr:endonuclease VII domain-containing protein [Streptomyces sp. IMTB 2501]
MSPPRKGFRKCQRCERNRAEKFFTSARGKVCSSCRKKTRSASAHETRVQATYGLGPGEYAEMFRLQGGKCAICRQTRQQRLSVDHCHKSGVVRGLLCRRCNSQLIARGARDSPVILRNAADYLEDPPAIRFIGKRYHREDGKK